MFKVSTEEVLPGERTICGFKFLSGHRKLRTWRLRLSSRLLWKGLLHLPAHILQRTYFRWNMVVNCMLLQSVWRRFRSCDQQSGTGWLCYNWVYFGVVTIFVSIMRLSDLQLMPNSNCNWSEMIMFADLIIAKALYSSVYCSTVMY